MVDEQFKERVLQTARASVHGAVVPTLRAVTVEFHAGELVLLGYYDTGATEDDKELLDSALTEIAADLWQEIKMFRLETVELQSGQRVPVGAFVYQR